MASTSSGQLSVNSMLVFAEIIRLEFPRYSSSPLSPRDAVSSYPP